MANPAGFHVAAFRPAWYPSAQKRRAGEETAVNADPIKAPRMRVFPWMMTVGATARRSLSSYRLIGPMIIKGISINVSFASDAPVTTVEIGTSPVNVQEAGVALATPRPYTVLTELRDPFAQLGANSGGGIIDTTLGTNSRNYEIPLDLIVLDAETFVVIGVQNAGAGAGTFTGQLRVLEGVSREALELFH